MEFTSQETRSQAGEFGDGCTDGCREIPKTGPLSPDLDRLIDLWPALPVSVQQAVCALADLGNPETANEERARLRSEAAELIQSLEL